MKRKKELAKKAKEKAIDHDESDYADIFFAFSFSDRMYLRSCSMLLKPDFSDFWALLIEWLTIDLEWWAEDIKLDDIPVLSEVIALCVVDINSGIVYPISDQTQYKTYLLQDPKKNWPLICWSPPEKFDIFKSDLEKTITEIRSIALQLSLPISGS